MNTIIEIPILPHVKSLLLSMYGSEPLFANERNIIGKELEHLFASPPEVTTEEEKCKCDKISISISARMKPFYAKYAEAYSLGIYFEKVFHKLLHQHIIAQVRCNRRVKKAIQDFYNLYNISEDDYSLTHAEQSYYHFVKKGNSTMPIIRFRKGRPAKTETDA